MYRVAYWVRNLQLTAIAGAILLGSTLAQAGNVDQLLSRFSHEPTVREVQLAGMRYADVHPEKLRGYFKNAKYGKLLPRTRVRLDREFDYDEDVNINTDGEKSSGTDTDDDTDWLFQMEWHFDELLMSAEKIRIIRENARLVELRDDLLDEITKLYFDRRRLQVELLLSPPPDLRSQAAKELRLQELTAQLDALTGGFLSTRIQTTQNGG